MDDEQQLLTINESFSNEHLMLIQVFPWYANIVNYFLSWILPHGMTYQQNKKFFFDLKYYFWEKSFLFRHCIDQIIRRCVTDEDMETILWHHYSLDQFGGAKKMKKISQSRFYWLSIFKDSINFVNLCDLCQRVENIFSRTGQGNPTTCCPRRICSDPTGRGGAIYPLEVDQSSFASLRSQRRG